MIGGVSRDYANVTDRRSAPGLRRFGQSITSDPSGSPVGANAMRSILAFTLASILASALLLTMSDSAGAAAVRHSRPRQTIIGPGQHVVAPPSQDMNRPGVRVAPPGWSDEDTRRWLDDKSLPGLNAG
jgi:hypothetical protein